MTTVTRDDHSDNQTQKEAQTFEDGGPPLHVVLVPADPPELGGALAGGGLAEGTGLHCHSQCPTLTPAVTPATPTRCMAGGRPSPPLAAGLWFHCTHLTAAQDKKGQIATIHHAG